MGVMKIPYTASRVAITSALVTARTRIRAGRIERGPVRGRDGGLGALAHRVEGLEVGHLVPPQRLAAVQAATVGHRSTHVTETVYRHVIAPAIRGGAAVMDDVFGDDPTAADQA